MFIRINKNRSGSVSIQIIKKIGRQNKVLKTIVCAMTYREEELLLLLADAALLSQKNIDSLVAEGYQYIFGGRLKNESNTIKDKVLGMDVREGHPMQMQHPNGRLIITHSGKRAHHDKENRRKGLKRLEKK